MSSSNSGNIKDQLSTDHSKSEQQRVQKEQEYVKEKGREVASTATKVKQGHIDITNLPSNDKLTHALQHGQESLENLKNSERGQNINPSGEKVIDDIKRVLADEQKIISEKNEGDVLQNLVRDFWALLQELKQRQELASYFEEWQGTLTSVFSSGDFTQFFHQTGDMFTSMRDTDEFLALASELIDLMKIVIAESTEKLVGDAATKEEYRSQREAERHRVAREMRRTLGAMTQNDMWLMLIQKGKKKANQVQGSRDSSSVHADEVFFRVRESPNFQRLLDDFKILLQRLVGNQMSVDPLFEYSKKAIDELANDEELSVIVNEMQQLLPAIAENPTLLDETAVQSRLEVLARRADEAVLRYRNNPDVKGAKEESIKLMTAIKESSTSTQLLEDLKTLWHDIASDKSGEIIDPDVLKSLRQLIVPLLVEHLNNVPLPSVSDQASFLGKYVYTIDNMKISLPELIPENIHLRFEYEMDANPLELEATNQHTYLYLQASQIQLHLHDCHFNYERLTIPKHSDSGIFEVDTVGEGLTAWMKMELKSDPQKGQYLDVLKSNVKISKFHITFRDSKHNHLYELLTHLFSKKIKNGVIEMIQSKLKGFGGYFNEQIISIINQAKSSSANITKIAKEKTEQARQGIENLKVQAKEKKDSDDVQETKEEVKSTAKTIVERVSDKAQEQLDDAKVRIEQQRREKELDRAIDQGPSAAAILNSSPETLSSALSTPAVVVPPTHDSPIPFTSRPPASPSLLSDSSERTTFGSYSSPSAHHDSMQFSPSMPSAPITKTDLPPSKLSLSSKPSDPTNINSESAWVSAKPAEAEEETSGKRNDIPAL